MLTALVRDLVLAECRKPGNVFGPAFFDQHLAVVATYAKCLAVRTGADAEAVELAAYLHDISAVRDVATLADHARLSAAQARELLAGHGCAPETTERVVRAVASHSAPLQSGSPEEICVSNADAISQIVRPPFWLYFTFGFRRLGFDEGRQWLRAKLEANWNGMIPAAKELAGNRYLEAMELLA